jgi:hypothetical protein
MPRRRISDNASIRLKKLVSGEITVELPVDPLAMESTLGLGKPPRDPSRLITLGVPRAAELTGVLPNDFAGLTHFLEMPGKMRYFVVHLACSFDAGGQGRFLQASLGVSLSCPDEAIEAPPLAWSMEPICLPHVTELSRTQRIDASFKVISASVGREQKSAKTRCLVRAFNELQSDPRWEFRPAKYAEIAGTQRQIMVVQTSGRLAIGRVSLTAQFRRQKLIFRGVIEWSKMETEFRLRGLG